MNYLRLIRISIISIILIFSMLIAKAQDDSDLKYLLDRTDRERNQQVNYLLNLKDQERNRVINQILDRNDSLRNRLELIENILSQTQQESENRDKALKNLIKNEDLRNLITAHDSLRYLYFSQPEYRDLELSDTMVVEEKIEQYSRGAKSLTGKGFRLLFTIISFVIVGMLVVLVAYYMFTKRSPLHWFKGAKFGIWPTDWMTLKTEVVTEADVLYLLEHSKTEGLGIKFEDIKKHFDKSYGKEKVIEFLKKSKKESIPANLEDVAPFFKDKADLTKILNLVKGLNNENMSFVYKDLHGLKTEKLDTAFFIDLLIKLKLDSTDLITGKMSILGADSREKYRKIVHQFIIKGREGLESELKNLYAGQTLIDRYNNELFINQLCNGDSIGFKFSVIELKELYAAKSIDNKLINGFLICRIYNHPAKVTELDQLAQSKIDPEKFAQSVKIFNSKLKTTELLKSPAAKINVEKLICNYEKAKKAGIIVSISDLDAFHVGNNDIEKVVDMLVLAKQNNVNITVNELLALPVERLNLSQITNTALKLNKYGVTFKDVSRLFLTKINIDKVTDAFIALREKNIPTTLEDLEKLALAEVDVEKVVKISEKLENEIIKFDFKDLKTLVTNKTDVEKFASNLATLTDDEKQYLQDNRTKYKLGVQEIEDVIKAYLLARSKQFEQANLETLSKHRFVGGNAFNVVKAMSEAHDIDRKRKDNEKLNLDFILSCSIDLAKDDVLEVVKMADTPKTITDIWTCATRDGQLIRLKVNITMRTNIQHYLTGSREERVYSRVKENLTKVVKTYQTIANVIVDFVEIAEKVQILVDEEEAKDTCALDITHIEIIDYSIGKNLLKETGSDEQAYLQAHLQKDIDNDLQKTEAENKKNQNNHTQTETNVDETKSKFESNDHKDEH